MILLSQQDIRYFEQNGVVCLRDFLDSEWIDLLRVGFQKNMDAPGPYACRYTTSDAPGLFRDDYCNWQSIAEFRHVIFESNLAYAAAVLVKAQEIRFFHEHIFFKKSGTAKKTPWHQDLPYYCVDGNQGISFWIPLTPIDESNKIEFIAGSHAWGKLFRPKKFNGVDSYHVPDHLYEDLPDLDGPDAQFTKLSWTMNLGDVLAFDFRTVHGNTDNPKPNKADRRSIALRFMGENMRYSSRPGEKSPPFPGLELKPNDPLKHAIFPLVWPHTNRMRMINHGHR